MKNKLMKIVTCLTVLLFIVYFTNWLISLILKGDMSFDKLNLLIAFIGLFSTFGGALVGALISGQYTLKAIDKEKDQKRLDQISELQNILLFNADEVFRIFNKIFEEYDTNSESVLTKLASTDNNLKIAKEARENKTENLKSSQTNEKQCKSPSFIEFGYDDIKRIVRYIDILNEMSPKYYLLQSSPDKEYNDRKYYINLLYQLKQTLGLLRLQMIREEEKVYLKIKNGEKEKTENNIRQAFSKLMKVHYEIALVQPEELI